jgi:hypothetical protein
MNSGVMGWFWGSLSKRVAQADSSAACKARPPVKRARRQRAAADCPVPFLMPTHLAAANTIRREYML